MTPPLTDLDQLLGHATFLKELARGLVGDVHLAEDTAQDAYVAALERPPGDMSSPKGWLATVVRNRSINTLRERGRRRRRELAQRRDRADDPAAERAAALEIQRRVLDEVLRLDEPYHTCIAMRYYDGLPPREIARRLDVPVKTVRTRLHRGLERLRQRLDQETPGGRDAWMHGLAPLASADAWLGGSTAATTGIFTSTAARASLAVSLLAIAIGAWGSRSPSGPRTDVRSVSDAGRTAIPGTVVPAGETRVDATPVAPGDVEPAPTPASIGDLEVLVTHGDDGTHVVGATLFVTPRGANAGSRDVRRLVTDAAGRARAFGLPAGELSIEVLRGGAHAAAIESGQTTRLVAAIPSGVRVSGTVVDGGGRAVPGAAIWLSRHNRGWLGGGIETHADEHGRFDLRSISRERSIGARAPGFVATGLHDLRDVVAEREITLVLKQHGATVTGVVMDPDGEPVGGATVAIGRTLPAAEIGDRGEIRQRPSPMLIQTDEAGRFRYTSAMGPETEVAVMKRGFAVWRSSTPVDPSEPAHLEIHLRRGATLRGVVRGVDGAPAGGVKITASDPSAFPNLTCTTDDEGRFSLSGVPHGSRNVSARKDQVRAETRLQVEVDDDIEWNPTLQSTREIRGRVEDHSGNGLSGWFVSAEPDDGSIASWTPTDSDGRFRIADLADQGYALSASRTPVPDAPGRDAVRAQAGDTRVVLRVELGELPTAFVTGRFEDHHGIIAAGESLSITAMRRGDVASTTHSDEASFELGPLAAGRYQVLVHAGGRAVATSAWFDLAPHARHDVGLIATEPSASLVITLHAPGDLDIEKVSAFVSVIDGMEGRMLSRDGRTLSTEQLRPANYRLYLNGRGIATHERDLELAPGQHLAISTSASASACTSAVVGS